MHPIEPPIMLADGYDVFIYPNVGSLIKNLEPADIPGMDILCIDSRGLRLTVTTDGDSISVDPAETSPTGAKEGIDRLKYFLDFCKQDFDRRASLEQLIHTVLTKQR